MKNIQAEAIYFISIIHNKIINYCRINIRNQRKINIQYYNHREWLQNAWSREPNPIRNKGAYDFGCCYDCMWLNPFDIECKVHPYEHQERAYRLDTPFEVGNDELKKLTCDSYKYYTSWEKYTAEWEKDLQEVLSSKFSRRINKEEISDWLNSLLVDI